jgi:hypothetical protein
MNGALPTALPQPKACSICGVTEACIVIPSIAGSQNLCLLHYYTTGAHHAASMTASRDLPHKKKKSSLLVDNRTIHQQLPQVQDIFAEAFIDVQKEIREESARVFQSAANSDDPLAMLLDSNTSSQPRRSSFGHSSSVSSRNKKFKGTDTNAGFLRK